MNLTMDASYNGAPVTLTADTGPLSGLLGASAPWPIKLVATVDGAKFTVDGTLAEPAAGRGLAVTVAADIPDLAALSPLAGTALPPLKTIKAQFKAADLDGGDGVTISDLTLSMPNADLAGSASWRNGTRPAVTANLSAKQIDLDQLRGSSRPGRPPAYLRGIIRAREPSGAGRAIRRPHARWQAAGGGVAAGRRRYPVGGR